METFGSAGSNVKADRESYNVGVIARVGSNPARRIMKLKPLTAETIERQGRVDRGRGVVLNPYRDEPYCTWWDRGWLVADTYLKKKRSSSR